MTAKPTGLDAGAGLGIIVGYKLVKAVIEITFGLAFLFLASRMTNELHQLALHFREHATAAWSIALAERLGRAATARHVHVVALASLFDGMLSVVEGWALHRRRRWGALLVIGATSCLLPFEIASLVRHVTGGRVVLLLVNALIVTYLVRRRGSVDATRRLGE